VSLNKGNLLETYSRRQFLKFTGIAFAGNQINFLPRFNQTQAVVEESYRGRALAAVPVYNAPGASGTILTTLWPDSVVAIIGVENDWYRVAEGYVTRENVQPMTPYLPEYHIQIPETYFWAEVVGTVAPVRQFCAAYAPRVTRIGHGGVAQIVDYLAGEPYGWYGISDANGDLIGWSQTIYWQPIDDMLVESGDHHVEIDLQSQFLTARENGEVILQAPCSIGEWVKTGSYSVLEQTPSGQSLQVEYIPDEIYGVPWITTFGDGHTLSGAYWHNRFGKQTPGPSIQVTPLLAHWLYGWLNEGSRIVAI
jgi:hypothetical protein